VLTITIKYIVIIGAVVKYIPLVEGLSILGKYARIPIIRAAPIGLLTSKEVVTTSSLL